MIIWGLKIVWKGKGLKTKSLFSFRQKKELIIKIDKKYFRPLDIDYLKGDPKKLLKN